MAAPVPLVVMDPRLDASRAWLRERASLDAPLGRAGLALLLIGVALAGLHALAPRVVLNNYQFDLFIPLDAGWRVRSGQVPHLDFHTPVGALYYAAYGLAMTLFGPTAKVMLWVPAAVAPVVGLLTLLVTRSRLPSLVGAALALAMGLVALSPVQLDGPEYAHLASYNRVGCALVTVGMLIVALPRARRADAVDAVALAGLAVGLFFLKITLFGLLVGAAGLSLALVPQNRRLVLVGAAGAGLVLAASFAISELPSAYLADVRSAIVAWDTRWAEPGVNAPGPRKLVAQLSANAAGLAVVLLGGLWLSRTARPEERGAVDRAVLLAVGLTGGVLVVMLQNHDLHTPALLAPVAVVMQGVLRRRAADVGMLVLAALLAPRIWHDGWGVVGHFAMGLADEGLSPITDDPASPAAPIRWTGWSPEGDARLRLVDEGRATVGQYALLASQGVSDWAYLTLAGARAVDAHAGPDARVLSLTFSGPFPWLTGRPPPRDTLSWYDPGRTFGGDSPLEPTVLLADVDVVAAPKVQFHEAGYRAMWFYLGDALTRDFTPVETPLWTLWIRRSGTDVARPRP